MAHNRYSDNYNPPDDEHVFYDAPKPRAGAYYIPPPRSASQQQQHSMIPSTSTSAHPFSYDDSNFAQEWSTSFDPNSSPLATTTYDSSVTYEYPIQDTTYPPVDAYSVELPHSTLPEPSWPHSGLEHQSTLTDQFPLQSDSCPRLEAPQAIYAIQPVLDPSSYSYPPAQGFDTQAQLHAYAPPAPAVSQDVFDQGYGSEVPPLVDSVAFPLNGQDEFVSSSYSAAAISPSYPRSAFSSAHVPPSRSSSLAGWANLSMSDSQGPSAPSSSTALVYEQQPPVSPVVHHHQQQPYQTQQMPAEEAPSRPEQHQQYEPAHQSQVAPAPAPQQSTTVPPPSGLRRTATMPEVVSAPIAQASSSSSSLGIRSASEFDISSRPIEEIRASDHVRQAAKLHVDVGQADINSPSSHQARVKHRRSTTGRRASQAQTHGLHYSPYQHERDERRGSTSSSSPGQSPLASNRPRLTPPQVVPPVVPSSPNDRYGAQHTFVYNPYNEPHVTTAPDSKPAAFPPPLAAAAPVQHQTINLNSPITLDTRGKNADRITGVDPATGERKPFLACGFCRQRKICCGQRDPHPRDNELPPDGPRTCNQCARRHYLCRYPSESRRGLRKERLTQLMVVDGKEVEMPIEEEPEYHPDGRRKRKKGRGPLEWITAVDAWLITPLALQAEREEEAKRLAAKVARGEVNQGAGPCPRQDKEDPPPPTTSS